MKISLRTSLLALPLVLVAVAGCATLASTEKKAVAQYRDLCATQSHERIYQTAHGVKGYLWVSPWPLIGAIDSAEHMRQINSPDLFAAPDYCDTCLIRGVGLTGDVGDYSYVEIKTPDGKLIRHDEGPNPYRDMPIITSISTSSSRYVVSFEDIATPEMKALQIGGSRMLITDSATNTLMGERTMFSRGIPAYVAGLTGSRGPWGIQGRCSDDNFYYVSFTLKVLNPN